MLRTALTAVVGATIALGTIAGCSIAANPIDQYLDEVYAAAEQEIGMSLPEEERGQVNTAALLAGALTCGLKDDPLFAQSTAATIETNPLAKVAVKYCDTVFNDPLTPEEMERYGVRVPGTPTATHPPVSAAIPQPPAQGGVDAVTDAQDAAANVDTAQPFAGYTCEPNTGARMDDPANPNMITNKSCDDLTAKKEAAQREYAEEQSMSIGDNGVDVDTYCDPGTGMMLDGTPCGGGASTELPTSGETQFEYGCQQGYITEGC